MFVFDNVIIVGNTTRFLIELNPEIVTSKYADLTQVKMSF